MSLDLEIQTMLRTNEVQQINFTMTGGSPVSGPAYWELSHHFSDNFMASRIRVTTRVPLGPRMQAAYTSDTNKIHVQSADVMQTAHGRSIVLHECTHALFDLRALRVPIRHEESGAFIATAWYLMSCGEDVAAVHPGFPIEYIDIADELRKRSISSNGASVALTRDQIIEARQATAHVGYSNRHYQGDGIGRPYRGP